MAEKRTKCSLCQHERRSAIDEALVRGTSFKRVADDFGVGRMSVWRHQHDNHVLKVIVKAHEASEVARADDLLGELRGLTDRARGLLARAERAGDLRGAASAIRESRGCLEPLARMTGELQANPVANIAIAPEWTALRGRILVALEPYSEAREAVVKALEAGDATG